MNNRISKYRRKGMQRKLNPGLLEQMEAQNLSHYENMTDEDLEELTKKVLAWQEKYQRKEYPTYPDIVMNQLYNHFIAWVKKHSICGMTDVLDFSKYDHNIDCWAITFDDKTITNPSMEQLIEEYSKS